MVKGKTSLLLILILIIGFAANNQFLYAQAPVNDNCSNAIDIPIPSNGFGLGNFISAPSDLTNATVQTGEAYAPAIFVAALDKKSVWYKFSIPTIRAVRVTLTQPGTTITAGNAGFAVYQTNGCLPTNASISSKLTPIVTFGNTYHPCVPAGDYLIQVSSKIAANGPVTIAIEISDQTGAAYDHPNQAYAFGVANVFSRKIDFEAECQSIEDATEVCSSLNNFTEYHKSAWFTFTTPAYLDYVVVGLSGTGAATYFPGGGANIQKKFGYNLYRGDAVTTPISGLILTDGCDSLLTNGYLAAKKQYRCGDLQPNTTYSIQLFIHKDFKDMLRLAILTGGVNPTAGPLPVNTLPASNKLGILPATGNGATTSFTDYFGCNSRHSNNGCGPSKPATGITVNGIKYNLSSFASFSLNRTVAITFRPSSISCGPRPIIRLFRQSLTASCASLDTANIVGIAIYNGEIECLAPGDYVLQVLGLDTAYNSLASLYYGDLNSNSNQCLFTNLGTRFQVDMEVFTRKAASKYSLNVAGAFDSINRVGAIQQPLLSGVPYRASPDSIGCQPTLRPFDTTCSPLNDKIIYRQFIVADSGTVDFSDLTYSNNPPFRYKLYSGDANALATAQNIFNYPDKFTGIVPKSLCMTGATYCENKTVCVVPGTYSFASMGSTGDVGRADRPTFTFVKTRTQYNSLQNALDMGSILDTLGPNGGTLRGKRDYWSCNDNAIPINGYSPCALAGRPATKAIYRQFYLNQDAIVRFSNPGYGGWCVGQAYGTRTLFYGKATDGMTGLSPVGNQWNCFTTAGTTNNCSPLSAGWYTVVSWATGPNYDSTMRLTQTGGRYNGYVSYFDEFDITITPACPGPKFNRPYKASVSAGNAPHLIQWGIRAISTPVYPRTDTSFNLPVENFNCTVDTPFANHPVVACEPTSNRVAYYVFRTTQVSFLQINTGGYFAAVYDKDVRLDSLEFATARPIQECTSSIGNIQFCHFQPGTYTLVIFAKDANICRSVAPSIFIDQIGYSRFDFAGNAYDFGIVPPDSVFHFGKTGDINPLHPTRPPSSDFIYCTTGAFSTDPANAACDVKVNGNIYSTSDNQPLYDSVFPASSGNIARRNLWYTFVVDPPGTVNIKVENKTLHRGRQPRFAVYSSDVDASLPFSAVQSGGLVDSTVTAGLKFVTMNYITSYYCYNAPNNISFYRDPCTATPTRYYILVDNVNAIVSEAGGQLPNTQIDVSIMIDSFNLVLPKFDHYYQADDLGAVGVGTYTGRQDNYSCATRSAADPLSTGQNGCSKTLWYKFTSTITGNIRYRIRIGANLYYTDDDIQLQKETIPGDSTSNSLKVQPRATVNAASGLWSQSCVTTGTYYLILPGCARVNQYVFPEIELIEQEGDFCNRAVPTAINGAGAASASVLVNCHTIGTDYGEFGPQLTCPPGAKTGDYKSSWFRIDIGGTDTLDVTTYLQENTNAASSDIKYRLMTGDCGAMQEQSCVLDALTQNTYQCLAPGQSYYVQVFTPVLKNNVSVTGTIDLILSSISHADTCAPLTNCLANANFDTAFNCSTGDSVKFVNFSTYGTSIIYKWDFGYNGQKSTAVSPSFFYPALPNAQTYTVKLVVTNTSCSQKDSVTRQITIPGRPFVNLGADINQCGSTAPIILKATSHPGATYLWQNNSVADSFRVTATGNNNYRVTVTYNGCSRSDTVKVLMSPVSARPLQQINLCTDSVLVNVRRGFGETYRWNTGATTQSIYMSRPGFNWVDITYFNCVYRDSFEVNNVNASRPFGADTTVCLTNGGFVLNAAMPGAVSYAWQNNSTADSILVTTPGQYRVAINFGNCTISDTIQVSGYPAPITTVSDTTICYGERFQLPWGADVVMAGTYRDTLKYGGGCDSMIRVVNLNIKAKPSIGQDTTVCFSQTGYSLNATTAGAVSYTWQDGATTPLYSVNIPGLYWVQVNFGNCASLDSILIQGFSSPKTITTDTSICYGSSFRLPWGPVVQTPGIYSDTIPYGPGGCDSLIRIYQLNIIAQPALGGNATVNSCRGSSINLTSYFDTTGLTTNWTLNNIPVLNPSSINTPGSYRLVATNAGGCSDTATVTFTIAGMPLLGNDTTISICQGSHQNLTAVFPANGLSPMWTLNGIVVSSPASVSSPGIYQLIVYNNFKCADTALLVLAISPKQSIGNDTALNICQGASANLTSLYNTAGLSSNWFLGGNRLTNPAAISLPGIYQLIAGNQVSCPDTAFVTVITLPTPNLGKDTIINICTGNSFNLASLYNTGNNISRWSFNGTAFSNPAAVTNAGSYQMITTSLPGCADTVLVTIGIVANPLVVINNPAAICAPLKADLTISSITSGSASNLVFTYFTDTAAKIPISNPAAAIGGRYYIKGTNTIGCYDIKPVVITYYEMPIVNAGADVIICDKDSAILNAAVTNISAPVSYLWEPASAGGIASPTAAATLVKPSRTQRYTVSVKDSYGCNFVVTDTVMVIMQPPVPAFAGNDTIIVAGTPHQLQASGGVDYTWSPGNVLNNRFVANPMATLFRDSTMLTVIVKDIAGCIGYDTIWIKAFNGVKYYVPNAFSPNGDGLNDVFRPIPAGIASTELFRIFNRYGELVYETSQWMKGWDGLWKGRAQPGGNYVWILKGKDRNGKTIEMEGNVMLIR